MVALKKSWVKVSDEPEAKIAFETWQKYLTVTYGKLAETTTPQRELESGVEVSELEDLFVRHTYLSSIARLLIRAALSQGKTKESLREVARDVLSGRYFQSKRLANLANVKGIDIHPVAVTISRATYVLALGPLVRAARKLIQIPVYLADSLFLPREVEQNLIERLTGIEISYGQRKDVRRVVMPQT